MVFVLKVTDLFVTSLDVNNANDMIRMVSDTEIKNAMFFMGNEKSPGLDSFTTAFFKESWDIVGKDVILAVHELFINDLVNLCFANDLFFFAYGNTNSARVIMESFEEFKIVSGLVPSLPKSTAYFCNVTNHYPKDSGFELASFLDTDHGGCLNTRKSISREIQFLGDKLFSWMSKKQDCTTMSSAEAEYVTLSASCAEVMWMRTQLKDYGCNYNKIPLYCDSQLAIGISCNPVQHSRIKHIHTRYHFIKEQVSVSCQMNWYEMFDSSRTGGSGK
nr:uncharacterized mitochondrial protein AtMg00810-like [Tanacetum cinerariifolium]